MTKLVKILKNSLLLLIIFSLFLYKDVFISLFSNISAILTKNEDIRLSEITILKEKISYLEKEYNNLTDIQQFAKYNYIITRLSYHSPYEFNEIYIYGGIEKNIKENYPLFNKDGVVGIINEVKDGYSKATLLTGIDNLSVKINNSYATLSSYKDGLFLLEDISNYDEIALNDIVYTSTLGTIKESLIVGKVYKIEEEDIEKKVYIKSDVDFNNINYLLIVGDL